MQKHKILIISGGGVFGCIPAFLLYSVFGKNRLDGVFNAFGGTSVGSILTLAYASGATPEAVHDRFNEMAREIFSWNWRKLSPWGPKYSNASLIAAVKEMIPGKYGDIKTPVIIPVTDFENDTVKVYDNICSRDDLDHDAWELFVESSAAPTYFPPFNGKVDGGLWDNIPVMTTATALHDKLGIAFEDMDIFVIGTGSRVKTGRNMEKVKSWMSVQWLSPLLDSLTGANENATLFWTKQMPFNSYDIYNPVQVTGSMDDPDVIEECEKNAEPFIGEFRARMNKFLNT